MTTEVFTSILLFVGGIVAAVLYVLDRQGKRLSQSIPPELLPVLMGLLALAETLAATTPTMDDDQLVAKLKEALQPPVAPPAPVVVDPAAQG